MIDSGHPLGHPLIISVIRLKGKSLVMPKNSAQESFASAGEAHVGPYLPQARTAIANQACAEIIIPGHGFRRAEGGPYHVIIEVRRSHRELSLLEGQEAIMVPRRLPEGRERKRMGIHDSGVSLARCGEVRKQVRSEKSRGRSHRFERPQPAQDLVTIVTGHPYGSNLPRLLAAVEDWRATHIRAAVRQVDCPLGIIGKAGDELRTAADHFMRLAASAGHLPGHDHVAALAVRSAERITRERARRR